MQDKEFHFSIGTIPKISLVFGCWTIGKYLICSPWGGGAGGRKRMIEIKRSGKPPKMMPICSENKQEKS